MYSRKYTAWRKNRNFGDIYGGRRWPKISDNIFNRLHSLQPPVHNQEIPILIEDNPSRDFFFPLSGKEALIVLRKLPAEHTSGITHLWLRKIKKSEYEIERYNFAEFICGRGVKAIILYPWPSDLSLRFGPKKPQTKTLKEYSKWTNNLVLEKGAWILKWTPEALRQFYAENLLLHEVGHHIDYYQRHWSKSNRKQAEDFANQYAVRWSHIATEVFNALD